MLHLNQFSFSGMSAISLCVKAGECIGLSGISGCGKTRLLRAIADLDEHQGELQLDTVNYDDIPANQWRQQVALLPAESQWWFDTIGEHFMGHVENINQLGFSSETANWESSRCSSGEKQRLSILRMLVNKPRVLLLDEPTANLDEHNSAMVEQLINDYLKQNNAVAIWVSHNASQLQRVSQRQFVMQDANVIECTAIGNAND